MSVQKLQEKSHVGDTLSKEYQKIAEDFDDIDPKNIHYLIRYQEKLFVVFLDPDSGLHWKTSSDFNSRIKNEEAIESTIAQIRLLQNDSTSQLLSKTKKMSLGRILGEALVQQFVNDSQMVETCMIQAAGYLSKRKSELSNKWQMLSSMVVLLVFSAVFAFIYIVLQRINGTGITDYIYFFMYSYFGAVGAFLSIIQKARKVEIDCESGYSLVFLDVVVKLLVGVISAFIALCFTQIDMEDIGFMANGVDKGKISLILVCIVAGFSERLMPSIVNRVEKAVESDDKQFESDKH